MRQLKHGLGHAAQDLVIVGCDHASASGRPSSVISPSRQPGGRDGSKSASRSGTHPTGTSRSPDVHHARTSNRFPPRDVIEPV